MRLFKPSLSILLLVILLLAVTAFLAPSASFAARSFETGRHCLNEAMMAFEKAPAGQQRALALAKLLEDIKLGKCPLDQNDAWSLTIRLLQIATTDPDPVVRLVAGGFLRSNPHPDLADNLALQLETGFSRDQERRDLCIDVLANLRDRRAEPFLLARLETPHDEQLLDTLEALALLGNQQTIDSLQAMYEDPESQLPARSRLKIPATIADIQMRLTSGFFSPFSLEEATVARLQTHGFAVTLEQKNEMYEFYDGDFPYVTTDVVFHTAMVLVRAALEGLEQQGMRRDLGAFCAGMAAGSLEQANRVSAAGAPPERSLRELALFNAAFFAVPARLCLSEADTGLGLPELPAEVAGRVATELVLIQAEAGVSFSPVLNCEEDFARYRPRGRFAGAGFTLENYSRAITWLGRASYPVQEDDATRRALLLVDVLDRQPDLLRRWSDLDTLLTLLFGRHDDGTFAQYRAAVEKTGDNALALLAAADGLDRFRAELKLPRQAINTAFLPWSTSMDWQDQKTGLRVLGQRYSPDSELFQLLMDDGQWPVSGLHVVSGMMGSQRAADILQEAGFRPAPAGVTLAEEPTGLVEQSIHCLQTLFQPEVPADDLYRTLAWQEKQINAALGGWAEVRHATAPYVKDATTYLCCSLITDRIHGYVEPYPEFYERLKGMMAGLHQVLQSRHIYSRMAAAHTDSALIAEQNAKEGVMLNGARVYSLENDSIYLNGEHLPGFMNFLDRVADLSRRELAGQDQTVADGQFLKQIGWTLKKLSLDRSNVLPAREPMSHIIDVATEYQSGTCLEVGVSRPMAIFVLVRHKGERIVCRGGVYTYHEFTWPAADRLDDQRWRTLDNRLDLQNRPPWLTTRPLMGLQRPVQKEELEELEHSRLVPKDRWYKIFEKDPTLWDGAVHLAGTTAGVQDIPQLIRLAEMDPGNPGVCRYTQDRLIALGDQPQVAEYFHNLARQCLKRGSFGREATWLNFTAIYRHLASRGAGARRELEKLAVDQLRILNWLGFREETGPDPRYPEPLGDHLKLALIQGRTGHPARWVWPLAEELR